MPPGDYRDGCDIALLGLYGHLVVMFSMCLRRTTLAFVWTTRALPTSLLRLLFLSELSRSRGHSSVFGKHEDRLTTPIPRRKSAEQRLLSDHLIRPKIRSSPRRTNATKSSWVTGRTLIILLHGAHTATRKLPLPKISSMSEHKQPQTPHAAAAQEPGNNSASPSLTSNHQNSIPYVRCGEMPPDPS